jgi:hypothetical protein
LFSFIDVRIIKEVNEKHWELERPHMKKLYEDVHVFGKENFYIDSDYVKGYKGFDKPEWWREEFSLAYRCYAKQEDFFGNKPNNTGNPAKVSQNAPNGQIMRPAPVICTENKCADIIS